VIRGEEISTMIDPEKPLSADEKLIVIANVQKLSKLGW